MLAIRLPPDVLACGPCGSERDDAGSVRSRGDGGDDGTERRRAKPGGARSWHCRPHHRHPLIERFPMPKRSTSDPAGGLWMGWSRMQGRDLPGPRSRRVRRARPCHRAQALHRAVAGTGLKRAALGPDCALADDHRRRCPPGHGRIVRAQASEGGCRRSTRTCSAPRSNAVPLPGWRSSHHYSTNRSPANEKPSRMPSQRATGTSP